MKKKILIVDDIAPICTTISMILDKKGYETATANDGLTAIELVKENSFDLILLDIIMQPINGVETYKELKKIQPGIKVVMMTGYVGDDLITEAEKEGVNGIIYKPMHFDKLIALIEEYC